MDFSDRLKHAWNAFSVNEEPVQRFVDYTMPTNFGPRPDRMRFSVGNERSIISSIYTRLAIDVASVDMRHVRLDNANRFLENIDSGLNNCLTVEANIDQTARAFRQDIANTLFEKGVCAVVPVDTTVDPRVSTGFDIKTLRVGEVVTWYPQQVKVSVYNEMRGRREDVLLDKRFVAIIENPLYSIMNEPNSTLQRLIRKLGLMDAVDEQAGSGKLDLIIQLPYVIKSDARRQQAEQRRKDIEFQLKGSQYGIAYTDGTERITQLNRPLENNLLKQVEYLTTTLYAQLGITPEVLNGTADEKTMLNYNNRTVKPIVSAIRDAMYRTFLTKTARSQKQSVEYFLDPFSLVPINNIADIADKFTRNEILSSNEVRQIIGFAPSGDPKADQLRNSNMPQPADPNAIPPVGTPPADPNATAAVEPTAQQTSDIMNQSFDELSSSIDDILNQYGA